MGTQVIMPQLGESVVEGKISRWLKQVGEPVALYEPILEVETDKVTTEVTASGEGTLLKLYFNEGDVVKAGTLIAFIGAAGLGGLVMPWLLGQLFDAHGPGVLPPVTLVPPEYAAS